MSMRNLIALCLIALASASCGSSEEKPPTVGETKSFATACDKANEGKRIAVDGFFDSPIRRLIEIGGSAFHLQHLRLWIARRKDLQFNFGEVQVSVILPAGTAHGQ